MGEIYGIKDDEEVTPEKARDAIVKCFIAAHKEAVEEHMDVQSGEAEKIAENVVRKAFEMSSADFDNPKKEDFVNVCEHLATIAKSFRNPEIINKHYAEIMSIVERIK
jgi:hypothetical protein